MRPIFKSALGWHRPGPMVDLIETTLGEDRPLAWISLGDRRCPLQSLPHPCRPPGGVLLPQFPDVAVPSSRQVCWVHRDEVIGSFTLLSLPSRQEEHLGSGAGSCSRPGLRSTHNHGCHSHTCTRTSDSLASALEHTVCTHIYTDQARRLLSLWGNWQVSAGAEASSPIPAPRTSSPQGENRVSKPTSPSSHPHGPGAESRWGTCPGPCPSCPV